MPAPGISNTQFGPPTQALNATLTRLDFLGRHEHFDADGGGAIVRQIYCEPYTAHKRVLQALRGSVMTTDSPPNSNSVWSRMYPHNDPLYPWFYCNDAQVEAAFKPAARSARPMGYTQPANGGTPLQQFQAIQNSLNIVDDVDGTLAIDNIIGDPLSPNPNAAALIAAGGGAFYAGNFQGDTQTVNTGETIPIGTFTSGGPCGAIITATYSPLLFQPGINAGSSASSGNLDPFDYVDPQWEPLTLLTQVGKQLFFVSPLGGNPFNLSANHGGLLDTFQLPEVVWRFSIRRLMVPFIPYNTIGAFTNKINNAQLTLGYLTIPPGTWRLEATEIISRRGPDGNIWFDILLKFLVRRLYDEYYQPYAEQAEDGSWGEFTKGWVDWNHQYGIPSSYSALLPDNLFSSRSSYYPVAWNGGLFSVFGPNHSLFLRDSDVDLTLINNGAAFGPTMLGCPFHCGFQIGQ